MLVKKRIAMCVDHNRWHYKSQMFNKNQGAKNRQTCEYWICATVVIYFPYVANVLFPFSYANNIFLHKDWHELVFSYYTVIHYHKY